MAFLLLVACGRAPVRGGSRLLSGHLGGYLGLAVYELKALAQSHWQLRLSELCLNTSSVPLGKCKYLFSFCEVEIVSCMSRDSLGR